MPLAVWIGIFLIAGYLSGSVNYAIIITRVVTGKDIRTLGNLNPGTSNVAREVGKTWGILVGLLDALKGVIPVLIARIFVFDGETGLEYFLLYAIGVAAVLGHCRPVWFGFKGGGGIGTMQGVSLFLIPVEYLFSMIVGGIIVLSGVKDQIRFRIGRWVPIIFTTVSPFVVLATALWLDIPLFAHIRIGGHTWGIVAGSFMMSLSILALSRSILKESTDELKAAKAKDREQGSQEEEAGDEST